MKVLISSVQLEATLRERLAKMGGGRDSKEVNRCVGDLVYTTLISGVLMARPLTIITH